MRLTPILLVLASSLDAQAQAERKLPADREAYAAAGRIEDPTEKVAAYEKFLRDFPGAPQAYSAQRAIFETTVELHRGDRNRVINQAKRLLKSVPPNDYGRLANAIAAHLHKEQLFPKDAERFAQAAAESPGSDSRRAAAEDTLGQIYRRAGDHAKAERWLRRALNSDPTNAGSATALGEMAAAAGRHDEALSFFAQARLARPNREAIARLSEAWSKTHNSAAGLPAYLDQRYRQIFPSPVRVEPYVPTARQSQRVVLAEVHTGAGCGPCVAADLAIDAALERYSRQHLAVVMYHQHIPLPDPLTNDSSVALFKERGGRGVPNVRIDGQSISAGGLREHAAKTATELSNLIDRRLETAPSVMLRLEAQRDGPAVKVTAQTENAPADTRLRLVLVEKLVRYSGESSIRFHPMVARSVHNVTGPSGPVEHRFELKSVSGSVQDHLDRFETKDERHNPDGKFRFVERQDALDESNLAVVAYIENNKEVLQAAYADLRP